MTNTGLLRFCHLAFVILSAFRIRSLALFFVRVGGAERRKKGLRRGVAAEDRGRCRGVVACVGGHEARPRVPEPLRVSRGVIGVAGGGVPRCRPSECRRLVVPPPRDLAFRPSHWLRPL